MNQKNYNIIICDNQPVVINGLAAHFSSLDNYNLIGKTNNGNELREILNETNQVNILIIDLKIPKTNVYRLIKDFVVIHPDMKIVVFSNYTMPKLVQDMMEFGVSAYLSKTATLEEVAKTVEKVANDERIISSSVYEDNKRTSNEVTKLMVGYKDNFAKFSELTEREMDIIILLSRGLTNKEMAAKLNLSIYTVETHRKNVMKKLQLKTSAQLMYFASQQGII